MVYIIGGGFWPPREKPHLRLKLAVRRDALDRRFDETAAQDPVLAQRHVVVARRTQPYTFPTVPRGRQLPPWTRLRNVSYELRDLFDVGHGVSGAEDEVTQGWRVPLRPVAIMIEEMKLTESQPFFFSARSSFSSIA